jgi:hypothetical protein
VTAIEPPTRIGLAELNPVPADPPPANVLRIVSFEDFVTGEDETGESLVGTDDETILPAGGMLLMYGDGGAGKTTLTVDAVAHLAAGIPWLTLQVGRPLRVLVIENEGPRMKFRQLLARKADAWQGPSFREQVNVLEDPWLGFTFTNESHRSALAAHVAHTETDVVVVGPLQSLGIEGGGTPEQISMFEGLVADTRQRCPRAFGLWLLHHENKAGDVSGAWERVPDTMLHVQAVSNGSTQIHWRKARWASSVHGTSHRLAWASVLGYELAHERGKRDAVEEVRHLFMTGDVIWLTARDIAERLHMAERTLRAKGGALELLIDEGFLLQQPGPIAGRRHNAIVYRMSLSRAEALFQAEDERAVALPRGSYDDPPADFDEG